MKSYSSVLLDKETTEYVERNDVAGLISKIEAEKATLLSSADIVGLRSKIIGLARLVQPFTLKDGKWKWDKKRQDVMDLEKLADGILSENRTNAIKNLKWITLGSIPEYDSIYKELGLNHSEKGDWSFVMQIGQSLNLQGKPFMDSEKINEIIPVAYRIKRGKATQDDLDKLKELKIPEYVTSQKRSQLFMQAITSSKIANLSIAELDKKMESLSADIKKIQEDTEKRIEAIRKEIVKLNNQKTKLLRAIPR